VQAAGGSVRIDGVDDPWHDPLDCHGCVGTAEIRLNPGGHRLQLRGNRRRADRADDEPAASEILRGQPATSAARDPDDQDRVTAIGRTEFRLHVIALIHDALLPSFLRHAGSRDERPARANDGARALHVKYGSHGRSACAVTCATHA